MTYLDPELILGRFARFARGEVRSAVDDEFVHAQVGSMASTLQFLAGEVGGRERAVEAQRQALREQLDDLETVLDSVGVDSPELHRAVETARQEIDGEDGPTPTVEETLLRAAEDVLTTIDAELAGETAERARDPIYEFLRVRTDQQLRLLGREDEE